MSRPSALPRVIHAVDTPRAAPAHHQFRTGHACGTGRQKYAQKHVLLVVLIATSVVGAAVSPGEHILLNGVFESESGTSPSYWDTSGSNVGYQPTGGPGKTGAVVFSNPSGQKGSKANDGLVRTNLHHLRFRATASSFQVTFTGAAADSGTETALNYTMLKPYFED